MSLFTDNDVLSLEDLSQIDSEIGDVAAAEEMNVEGRPGIIRQTWVEAKNALLKAQQQYAVSYWGAANVMNLGFGMQSSARVVPAQIVTSSPYTADQSAVNTWMAYLALTRFYNSASNRSVKDRYQTKADRFSLAADQHWNTLWSNGLPIVWSPMECPGAIHSVDGGIWGESNVTGVTGGSDVAMSYDVVITYVDQTRYVSPVQKNNGESGPSAIITARLDDNQRLRVSIAGLNPPNGSISAMRTSDGSFKGLTATAWNIYASTAGDLLTLQNVSPIPITQTTYTFTGSAGNTGPVISSGQRADINMPMTKLFYRG